MTEQLQIEVERKEIKPADKTGYKLRERVKKGELDPKEVLNWYKRQPEQFSSDLVTWLRNRIIAGKKKKEEKPEVEVENKDKKKNKGKRFKGGKPRRQHRSRQEQNQKEDR